MSTQEDQQTGAAPPKKRYRPPRFERYGAVKDLTTSGSGDMLEGFGTDPKKMP